MSMGDRFAKQDKSWCRLCGYTPFRSDDPAKLAAETQRGKIEFRE